MSKKAGAVKEKKGAKVRLDTAAAKKALEGAGGEPKDKPKAMDSAPSRSREDKKAQVKGKDVRKEAGKPKRSFYKEAVKFFQSTWAELKRVHWPNRSEIVVYTAVVVGSVVALALLIWMVDSALSWLLEMII